MTKRPIVATWVARIQRSVGGNAAGPCSRGEWSRVRGGVALMDAGSLRAGEGGCAMGRANAVAWHDLGEAEAERTRWRRVGHLRGSARPTRRLASRGHT